MQVFGVQSAGVVFEIKFDELSGMLVEAQNLFEEDKWFSSDAGVEQPLERVVQEGPFYLIEDCISEGLLSSFPEVHDQRVETKFDDEFLFLIQVVFIV